MGVHGGPRGSTGVHGRIGNPRPLVFFLCTTINETIVSFLVISSCFSVSFFWVFFLILFQGSDHGDRRHLSRTLRKCLSFFFLLRPLFFLFLSFCFYVSHVETYFDSSSADGFLIYIYSQWFLSFFFFFFFLFYFEFNRRRRCRPLSLSFVVVC